MGSICNYHEKNLADYQPVQRQSSIDPPIQIIPQANIKFTTDPVQLIHQSQCLLLFSDQHQNLGHCQFLKIIDEKLAYHIDSYFKIALQKQKGRFSPGDCIFFQGNKEEIGVDYIAVLCMEIWAGTSQLKQPLEEDIVNCFSLIETKKIKKLSMSHLDDTHFGIPTNIAAKNIARTTLNEEKLKEIIVFCKNEESKQIYEGEFQKEYRKKRESYRSSANQLASDSDYF